MVNNNDDMTPTEAYYLQLLDETRILLEQAHEMLIDKEDMIAKLMGLLKQAQADIERLEYLTMNEKVEHTSH